jgi:hypothetical protein
VVAGEEMAVKDFTAVSKVQVQEVMRLPLISTEEERGSWMAKNIELCEITINVYDQLASSALPCEADGSTAVVDGDGGFAHFPMKNACCASFIPATGQCRY